VTSSDAATEVAAAEPTPPQRVLPTAVVALLVTVLCGLAAALALWSLHRMLVPPAGVTALLVALAVVALLPLVPAVRAFGDDRKRHLRYYDFDVLADPRARREWIEARKEE